MSDVSTIDRPWLRFYEAGVPHTLRYPRASVQSLLDDNVAQLGDRVASVFFGASLTYSALQALANRFAGALHRLGVRPGDRVSLHLPNCPQFLIGYYGALKAGAIVVPFNPLYVEREIEYQLRDCGAEVALTLDRVYPRLAEVRPRTHVREIIVTPINAYFPPLLRWLYPLKARREGTLVHIPRERSVHQLADLLDAGSSVPAVEVDPESTAVLLYTGGTTGVPKGAMLSHHNLVCNVYQSRAWFTGAHPGQDTVLAILPFFHSYGMTVAMNFSVSAGTRLALLPRFDVEAVLRAIRKYQPQQFPGVPTIYSAIISHPQVARYDLKSIAACISGAAPLPGEVQSRFEHITGGKLVEGYGLTEASPVTHANPLRGVRKLGSIGIPLPDTDARIVDDSGERTVPPGEVGELVIRGPQVMQGYWNEPPKRSSALRGGWLVTGDMAKMDADGFFYIVDRKKEMIITGGMNVFPREVEEVLYTHPAVREAAAIGIPDAYRGEVVKAYVVLRDGAQATSEEIIEHCRRGLAPFKVPRAVEVRTQLPKSIIGKVLRRVLREEEQATRGRPSPAGKPSA